MAIDRDTKGKRSDQQKNEGVAKGKRPGATNNHFLNTETGRALTLPLLMFPTAVIGSYAQGRLDGSQEQLDLQGPERATVVTWLTSI